MNKCKECDTLLTGRNKIFCSKICLVTNNGRKTGGWNKKERIKLICQKCGIEYALTPSAAARSKHCSRICHNRAININRGKFGKECPSYTSGISQYRKIALEHYESKCMKCSSNRYLKVHHKDENRKNNSIENLQILCQSCHQKEHQAWKNLPSNKGKILTRFPQPCKWCNNLFQRWPGKTSQKFCSHSCAMYFRNKK